MSDRDTIGRSEEALIEERRGRGVVRGSCRESRRGGGGSARGSAVFGADETGGADDADGAGMLAAFSSPDYITTALLKVIPRRTIRSSVNNLRDKLSGTSKKSKM